MPSLYFVEKKNDKHWENSQIFVFIILVFHAFCNWFCRWLICAGAKLNGLCVAFSRFDVALIILCPGEGLSHDSRNVSAVQPFLHPLRFYFFVLRLVSSELWIQYTSKVSGLCTKDKLTTLGQGCDQSIILEWTIQ